MMKQSFMLYGVLCIGIMMMMMTQLSEGSEYTMSMDTFFNGKPAKQEENNKFEQIAASVQQQQQPRTQEDAPRRHGEKRKNAMRTAELQASSTNITEPSRMEESDESVLSYLRDDYWPQLRKGYGWEGTPNCKWRGVRCNEVGRVIALYLDFVTPHLNGSVPAVLANLTALESLELDYNQLTSIDPEIWTLQLRYFSAQVNKISMPFPSELYSHPTLRQLILQNNLFYGTLSNFDNSSKIVYLILDDNLFSGPLPLFPPKCYDLSCAGNKFTGTVDILQNLVGNNVEIDVSNNRLNGTLPQWLCRTYFTGRNNDFSCVDRPSCLDVYQVDPCPPGALQISIFVVVFIVSVILLTLPLYFFLRVFLKQLKEDQSNQYAILN